MARKKISEVINYEGRKYRYNYTDAMLEWISEGEVIDSIGLSNEYAELALMDYVYAWHEDLEMEIAFEMETLF
jgi:hypothetical protein